MADRHWAWIRLGLGSACLTGAVLAQEDRPAPRIVTLEFEGNQHVGDAYLQAVIRTRVGDPLDRAALDRDVAQLVDSGKFSLIRYDVAPQGDGVRVIFHLRERRLIQSIRFMGNSVFNEKDLRKKLLFKEGDPLDLFLVEDGQEAILSAYRQKGYGQVNVTHDPQALEQGDVAYAIEEGPRVRVVDIRFEGRRSLDENSLKKQIQTKTAAWIFREGVLDEELLDGDAARLQLHYRNEGFLDARAGYRIDFGDKPGDRIVVFTIEEGPRYRIQNIILEGNTVFSQEELFSQMRSRVGQFFTQRDFDADRDMILSHYGRIGYIEREVTPLRIFADEPEFVLLTFQITEGEQYRVGRIVVRGNTRTQDKVVLREVNLFPPDDLFNLEEAREAETRLRQTQIFDSARVVPTGNEEGVRDVLVSVRETERIDNLIFGAGVTSNNGLVGSIVLDLKNFDLLDTPRNLEELFKFRAFHGAGQRLRLEAQPGTEFTRFRLDFTEPYLRDRPVRFDTGLFFFDRNRDGYTEGRAGGYFSLGKRFEQGFLSRWAGEVAFRAQNVSVDDVDLLPGKDILDARGDTFLTSVKGTLALDRTDNRLVPTRGDRFQVSYEQFGALGGDDAFGKLRGSYVWHRTLATDVLDRKHVLSLKTEAGFIVGDAPVFERNHAGGIGSLRGFEFRGIGPRQGLLDDNPVGGDFMLLMGAEYSFPLYGDQLRGVVFTDMGTVESGVRLSDWRASVGVGVRLTVDLFGPVPIEFDLATPILKEDDDEEQVFSFFIGTTFF